jgi:dihydropteroate synthase
VRSPELPERPLIMGVLNVTPASFSEGGQWFEPAVAIAHGRRLIAEGADLVDVGGESTRPGAPAVDEDEELRRVLPVVAALASEVRVSIDTTKATVARAAVAAGASLINDVSASLHEVAAETGAGWVAMHMRGTPTDMQTRTAYRDVVSEVRDHLAERAEAGAAAGVAEIWLDPGIGFAKTAEQNLQLLRHLDELVALGRPVLVGASRKSFLGALTGRSDASVGTASGGPATPEPAPSAPTDRLEASLATATWAMAAGARMVRAHDVSATVQAAQVVGS